MQEQTRYQQLQPEDRMTIASMTQQGSSKRAMARLLGRSPSAISREIKVVSRRHSGPVKAHYLPTRLTLSHDKGHATKHVLCLAVNRHCNLV